MEERGTALRNPIRGTVVGCCASTTAPHIANATPMATMPPHFRFWNFDFRLSEKDFDNRFEDITFIRLPLNPKSKIENLKIIL
jgi:hypothetical protein